MSQDEGEGTPLLPLVQPLFHIYQSNVALCRVFGGFVKKNNNNNNQKPSSHIYLQLLISPGFRHESMKSSPEDKGQYSVSPLSAAL